MGCVVSQVGQKRFFLLNPGFHEIHRFFRQVVDDKSVPAHDFAIVLQQRAEVVTPMPGAESIKLVKSPAVWMVRMLHAVVPFPEHSGGITGILEDFPNGLLIQIHALTPGAGGEHSTARMIPPGQKLGPGGGANRAYIEAVEGGALLGQAIDVWRVEVGVSMYAQVSPSLVIGQNNYDVGPCRGKQAEFYQND